MSETHAIGVDAYDKALEILRKKNSIFEDFYNSLNLLAMELNTEPRQSTIAAIHDTLKQLLFYLSCYFDKQIRSIQGSRQNVHYTPNTEDILLANVVRDSKDLRFPAHHFHKLKKRVVRICFDIMKAMFGIKDLETCVEIPGLAWLQGREEPSANRLMIVLIDQYYNTRIQQWERDENISLVLKQVEEFNENLTSLFLIQKPGKEMKAFIDEKFQPLYPELAKKLGIFLVKRNFNLKSLEFKDLKELLLTILRPFFANYTPNFADERLNRSYKIISEDCYAYGSFIEFGDYAILFGKLALLNEYDFGEFMPYIE